MNQDSPYWLDHPRNVRRITYTLYAACALLMGLDVIDYKHVHFPFEAWFGFFGFFGFIACVALVLAAKLLRVVLKREEDYYDR